MCILSRVRDQWTSSLRSDYWLRIVNCLYELEREKPWVMKSQWLSERKKSDWLEINSCVLLHQFQITIYWRHTKETITIQLLTHLLMSDSLIQFICTRRRFIFASKLETRLELKPCYVSVCMFHFWSRLTIRLNCIVNYFVHTTHK